MVSGLTRLAFGLSMVVQCLGQDRFVSEIPAAEAAALKGIVEDPEPAPPAFRIAGDEDDWESPVYSPLFSKPLPIPPVKQPLKKIINPITGKEIWYYELVIKSFTQQIYPNLKPAQLVGYDGISPGPTFMVPRGTETVVRVINQYTKEASVHLHGSPSRAPFDGWAEDVTLPGQYKDYYWPNNQAARFLWYHDHAVHVTAENAYKGQAGSYIITDPAENALGLPSGYGQFDIPLVLTSKYYNSDGTLKSIAGETDSVWGDVIHVNGQPWPFFNVQPRKYRFRLLNAAVSRSFALYLVRTTATGTRLPFQVIASDSGLLQKPVSTTKLYLSIAERYEIVVDFTSFKGQTLELRNIPEVDDIGTDDDYAKTGQVMRFVVSNTAVADTSRVPATLATVPFPPASTGVDHHFRFHRSNGEWLINDVGFADANNRVLANVPRGKVEIWELENSSGGWTHPIHVHLVDFRVLARRNADNNRGVLPYEAVGLKDVVWLARHETVLVEAHYAPWNGVYMFHCHNLIHEDNDMMAAFNVTALQNFGYNELTDFDDPMDPRWRARPFTSAEFTGRTGVFSDTSINNRVVELARQKPYSELPQVEAALKAYYGTAKAKRGEECDEQASGPIPRYRRFVV
ncbi:Cupredoxin [Sporormia fimetaria CBS 119925]|uniref:Cupredoxin n=1 Tax=Sporormia fimetaria CBS 119925 TaxID=1340428 RepID=A0A6A6VKS4_9PLEO|nr:Cupredoxin [Sporormia fimetaria CBS 119925]